MNETASEKGTPLFQLTDKDQQNINKIKLIVDGYIANGLTKEEAVARALSILEGKNAPEYIIYESLKDYGYVENKITEKPKEDNLNQVENDYYAVEETFIDLLHDTDFSNCIKGSDDWDALKMCKDYLFGCYESSGIIGNEKKKKLLDVIHRSGIRVPSDFISELIGKENIEVSKHYNNKVNMKYFYAVFVSLIISLFVASIVFVQVGQNKEITKYFYLISLEDGWIDVTKKFFESIRDENSNSMVKKIEVVFNYEEAMKSGLKYFGYVGIGLSFVLIITQLIFEIRKKKTLDN